jgi:Domain of unknown function (DUF4365)
MLLERPAQHETDSSGQRLLREVFEPIGVVNSIENDYGIDFDVQLFRKRQATGEWFKIQLKSSLRTRYSTDGTFISQRLDVPHARHFTSAIREPVFIVHADVTNRRLFWHAPQLDSCLEQAASLGALARQLTVRIPTANELPTGMKEFLAALEHIQIVLGAASVARSPVANFAQVISAQGEQEECIREFQDRIDALKLETIHRLVVSGSSSEAKMMLNRILSNDDSSIESKFACLLQEERILFRECARSELPQNELHQLALKTAARLRALTKKGPPALKLFAIVATHAAQLEVLAFRNLGLFMNWKLHVERGDPLMAMDSDLEVVESSRLVTQKYNQCLRLVRYAANSPYLWAMPLAFTRIIQGLVLFFIHLRRSNYPETLKAYIESAVKLCRLAADAAQWNRDDRSLSIVTTAAILLSDASPEDSQVLVSEILAKISDPDVKKCTEEVIDRNVRRMRGEDLPGDIPTTAKQAIQNMATALGIDLLNHSSPESALVHLGIKDMDPGRALAHCQRAFVSSDDHLRP